MPEGRQWFGVLLVAVGAVGIAISLGAGVWFLGQLGATGYHHTATPVEDSRCSTTGPAAEVYRYGQFEPAGQAVMDRALAAPGTTVTTETRVQSVEYGTVIDPAPPQYLWTEGACHRLQATQDGLGDPDPFVLAAVLGFLLFVACVGMVCIAIGATSYRRHG